MTGGQATSCEHPSNARWEAPSGRVVVCDVCHRVLDEESPAPAGELDVEALIDDLMALSEKMAADIRGDRPPPNTPDITELIRADLREAIEVARLKREASSPMERGDQPPHRGAQSQG